MPLAGITAQPPMARGDGTVHVVPDAPSGIPDMLEDERMQLPIAPGSNMDDSPETCQPVAYLLTQILNEQRAQLDVQKLQLSILERYLQDRSFSQVIANMEPTNCSEDEKERLGSPCSPWRSESVPWRSESANLITGFSGKDSSDAAPTHPRLRKSNTDHTLSDVLATPFGDDLSPSADETLRSLTSESLNGFPSGLSQANLVMWHLTMAGVIPTEMMSCKRLYSAYRAILLLAECFHVLLLFKEIFLNVDGDGPSPISLLLLVFQALLVHPLWRTWTKEFRFEDPTFQLLQQTDRRGFPWMRLHSSIRVCQMISGLLLISVIAVWAFFISAETTSTQILLKRGGSDYDGVIAKVSAVIDACAAPCQLLWFYVAPIHIWLVYLVARLHCHDLLCYAGAIVRAFEADEGHADIDLIQALRKLEVIVTARLRLASARWVRCVCFYMVSVSVIVLIMCMFLLTYENLGLHQLVFYSVACFFGLVFIISLCGPLAMVAETFEYDVLRALNTPSILKAAQKHVGQQLLSHLTHLDWGFRIGGSTISSRMVTNIGVGVLVTMVTSVSQAAFSRTNEI